MTNFFVKSFSDTFKHWFKSITLFAINSYGKILTDELQARLLCCIIRIFDFHDSISNPKQFTLGQPRQQKHFLCFFLFLFPHFLCLSNPTLVQGETFNSSQNLTPTVILQRVINACYMKLVLQLLQWQTNNQQTFMTLKSCLMLSVSPVIQQNSGINSICCSFDYKKTINQLLLLY